TRMFYFKHLALSDWARKKHEKLEKMVLDDASAVVAVSPLVQEEFKTMTGNRIELVTNGYDPEDFGQVVEPDGHFNIVHTGLFASDGNPETLWKVLSDLCREDARFADQLRIRLVGKNDTMILDSIHAAGLERNLVDLGYRDHTVAVREQMGSTMLILPLRKEPEYRATLPGKLFEYLGSQRPVLGIGQTDGAMARILADTGAGETFEWDDEAGIRAYVLKRWEKFLAGDDDSVPDNNIEQYSRKATARKMAALLESLID
ncbi:MAG: hypothetical protein II476_05150, partial [Bacteroidales bacterium]|nr:hypothetical protein [Bacteroidales bacterium]